MQLQRFTFCVREDVGVAFQAGRIVSRAWTDLFQTTVEAVIGQFVKLLWIREWPVKSAVAVAT